MTRLRTRAVYADQLPAHSRNFMVVAEGVEAWHEHDILKTEGCDYQGCLEARPMLADQLRLHPQVLAVQQSCSPDAVI